MRRLERYLLEEILTPFLAGVAVAVVVLLSDHLYKLMRLVITKGVGLGTVTRLLLFILPEMLVAALPLAVILGVSIGFNRLARENEWSSLRLGGLSLWQGVRPVVVFGLGVGLLGWVVGEHVAPAAKTRYTRLFTRLSLSDPTVVIEPQQWFRPGSSDNYFYVDSIDDQTGLMHNLIIFTELRGELPTALMAREARFEAGRFILRDVIRHVWRPDGTLQREGETREAIIAVERFVPEVMGLAGTASEMSSAQLRELVASLKAQGVSRPDQVIDLHRRYAAPVACFVLALMCVPLNLLTARRGSFVGLLIASALVIVYFLTLQLGVNLARQGVFRSAPVLGVWLQNLLFGGATGVLLWRCR